MKVKNWLLTITSNSAQIEHDSQCTSMFLNSSPELSIENIDANFLRKIISQAANLNADDTIIIGNALCDKANSLMNSRFENTRKLAPTAFLSVHDRLLDLFQDLNTNEDAAYLHARLDPITREIPRHGVIIDEQ